jgi:hypothetical protein
MNRLILLTVLFSFAVVNAQNFFPFDQGAFLQLKNESGKDIFGTQDYSFFYSKFTVTTVSIGPKRYFTLFAGSELQQLYRYDSTDQKLFILKNGEEKLAADLSRPAGSFDTLYIDGTPRYYKNSGIYYPSSDKASFFIVSEETPFPDQHQENSFTFTEGIGLKEKGSKTTKIGYGYFWSRSSLISAIVGQNTTNPIILKLSNPIIPPIYSNNRFYTLSVKIDYDYLQLLANLTLQIKLFSADSVVYSTVFSGDKATGEFNIFLPSLYMAVSDSIGFRFNCTDVSIFNNSVYLPQEGFFVVPVNKVLSAEGKSEEMDFRLFQNTPNPFNPSTTITWHQPSGNYTTLKLYDLLGKEVSKLVDSYYEAGIHQIQFNAGSLSSGTYFYTFRSGQYYQTRKMILTK